MREKSIMDNLNCKTQAHVRVCEENIGKNDAYWNNFVVKNGSLKDHIRRKSAEMYWDDILKDDSP